MSDALSQRYWSLLDAFWILTGWSVHEQIQEKEVFYSLDRTERLFALQCALEERSLIEQSGPQHYEDLVFVSLINGKKIAFASTEEKTNSLVQIMEIGRRCSELKKAFEFAANSKFCDTWYSLGKPFHWLSRWDRSYILSWAIKSNQDLPLIKTSSFRQWFQPGTIISNFENSNAGNEVWSETKPWRVKKVIHEVEFGLQIRELLGEHVKARLAPPTASEALKRWREVDTFGIYDVSSKAFRYRLRDGRMSEFVGLSELNLAIKNRVVWLDYESCCNVLKSDSETPA